MQNPLFVGFTSSGNQLWDIVAVCPTGQQEFTVEISSTTELAIHQAICNRINGIILTIGQNPLDSVNGATVPPPPVLVQLMVLVDPVYFTVSHPIIDATIFTSISVVGSQ